MISSKKRLSKEDPRRTDKLKAFDRLLTICDELRENCPWDKKQTWRSLCPLTLEEAYELSEAITDNQTEWVKEELGDMMIHLVMYARIASEEGHFDISDVLQEVCEKLIRRHPHVYEQTSVKNEQEVKRNWEKIKLESGNGSVLEGVPLSLPSVIKAIRIQDKVRSVGFDWEKKEHVWEKVQEELNELHQEVHPKDGKEKSHHRMTNEFGDLLFSLINYARFIDINPEDALAQANRRFIERFQCMERELAKEKKCITDITLNEMNVYWESCKKKNSLPS